MKHLKLLQDIAWLFAGEGVARITRLITAIILARVLTSAEFGLVAIILATDEIVKVMTRNGIGVRILQASDAALPRICNGVFRINLLLSSALAIVQIAAAVIVAQMFGFAELQPMIAVLALVYLIYPYAMVQVYRVQRRRDMRTTGLIFGAQVGLDNCLTAILAFAGMGVWAVVIPKVIVAVLWVVLYRRVDSWRFDPTGPAMPFNEIWRFSRDVFLVELSRSARMSVDRLIVGALLGVEALGLYFFAMNAGSGLSHSLIKAFNTAVMPKLCANRHSFSLAQLWKRSAAGFSLIVAPIIILQLSLAPWYVPIVFGEQWQMAIPLLMWLCAGMIFQGGMELASQVFRAGNQTLIDVHFNFAFTACFIAAIVIGSQFSLTVLVQSIFICQALALAVLSLAITRLNGTTHNNNNNALAGGIS